MYNDTHLNILVSYAYLAKDVKLMQRLKELTLGKTVNLMLDSGAFTRHNSKADMKHINVKDYSEWLKDFGEYSEKYVMLDVIGQAEQSRANYEYMLSAGLNPMYVATIYDNDFDYIRFAVSRNPNICVAGGATCKGLWQTKRYQQVYKQTNGKAMMHGLGYTTFPRMLQHRLRSVDSSSWKTAAARFGQTVIFCNKQTHRIWSQDILTGKRKFPDDVKELFRQIGVEPKTFLTKEAHYGECSIDFYINIVSAVEMQKYCHRHGLQYFLAVGALNDLEKVVYVSEHSRDITYKKFVNAFSK